MKAHIGITAVLAMAAVTMTGCGEKSADDDCPSGEKSCDSICVSLESNSLNCGHCGAECPPGSGCMSAQCVCQTGLTNCGPQCVDFQADGAHCGGCNQACPAGQVCSGGTCAATCQPGVTQCGNSCVDLDTHPLNCGSCGRACTGGATCSAGTCVGGQSSGTTCTTTEEELFSFFLISLEAVRRELFSFFLISLEAVRRESSSADGFGGDLGGLSGADAICQRVAESVSPCQANKTWLAFLSTSTVDAIDRIGQGPWHDRQGRLLANDISELLNDRPINADPIIIDDFPNEYGIPNLNPDGTGDVDNHEILTGSGTDGRLYNESGGGMDLGNGCGDNEQWTADKATCWDWTNSQPEGCPRVGHSWPAQSGVNWISVWNEGGCAPGGVLTADGPSGDAPDGTRRVGSAGGYGGWYCFAVRP